MVSVTGSRAFKKTKKLTKLNTKFTQFHSKYPKACARAHTHYYSESQTNTEVTLRYETLAVI